MSSEKIVVMPAAGNKIPTIKAPLNPKFTVLSVGRLVSLKGFDITVNAFAKFYWNLPKKDRANVQLLLIGKGSEKEYIEQVQKNTRLPKTTTLSKNWMDREVLQQYYATSHVFLFPSHEGAGMVVPEALSHGLPVVCFDNAGPGELMDKTCGFSIPYSNYEESIKEFSKTLHTLYYDKTLQQTLAQNAVKRFKNCHTWEAKGTRIQTIYNQLLAINRSPLTQLIIENSYPL